MQDSLRGKLDELGLDEILQIVGLSRRTGILTLRCNGAEAMLHFKDGLVVCASSSEIRQTLGELLVKNGIVGQETVRQALALQQQGGQGERIGVILRNRFQVELQQVERAVREKMATVVMTLFPWTDGEYDFVSVSEVATVDSAYLDPLQLMAVHGGTLEKLIAEGMRCAEQLNGVRRDSVAPVVPAAEALPSLPAVVVADDDAEMGRCIAGGLAGEFSVFSLTSTADALARLDSLCREGRQSLAVVDLIIPKPDGSGVLGGLDLVRQIRNGFPAVQLISISDFHHAEAVEELSAMGCRCLVKPRRGATQGESFAGFMEELRSVLRNAALSYNYSAEGQEQ